jgi:hypothetical protein
VIPIDTSFIPSILNGTRPAHAGRENMPAPSSLEERLEQVECDLAQLKRQVNSLHAPAGWLQSMIGLFKDDPEFDEVIRLGREQRERDRPSSE